MRQRVTLYIDGQKADLTDESLILFTYTAEEADNPSVVVNSYTRTLSLPATRANDIIFDKISIHTHNVRAGAFSPIVRTPFEIVGSTGERLETGYLKLDNIVYEGKSHHYDVTLYGGLGGLLYTLMYNTDGSERTLADMDYYESAQLVDSDFQFRITAEAVYDAWQQLCRNVQSNDRWNVINFAPMYNGIPEGFDANKCVIIPQRIKGYTPQGGYDTMDGLILTTFSQAVDEWRIKDLRSYLQRPVVNVRAVLDTIKEEASAAGYTLTYDAKFTGLFANVWMTLPRLSSTIKADGTGGEDTFSTTTFTLQYGVASGSYTAVSPSHGNVAYEDEVSVEVGITFSPNGSFVSGNTYRLVDDTGNPTHDVVYLLQLIATDSTGAIAASKIVSLSHTGASTASILAAIGGALSADFVSPTANAGEGIDVDVKATSTSSAVMQHGGNDLKVKLNVNAYNATSFRIIVQRRDLLGSQHDRLYTTSGTGVQVMANYDTDGELSWTGAGLRSGAYIDKQALLGGTMSPASFLLGLCRTYGFKLHYNSVTRSMYVYSRNNYYNGGVTDLTGRIDHAQQRKAVPYVFVHRFYRWALKGLGAYAAGYETTWDKPYGGMTIDTGFPFDNDTEDVLQGVPFATAADVLHRDAAFCLVATPLYYTPSPFLYGGAKYTLYNGDDSKEFDVPTIGSEYAITYLNSVWRSYDHYPKVEMQDDSAKGVDGFVLVKFGGRATDTAYGYGSFSLHLTDDTPQMLAMNNGKPCWRMDAFSSRAYEVTDAATYTNGKAPLPLFNRMTGAWSGGSWVVASTLEIATPTEIDIPDVTLTGVTDNYTKGWQKFIEDRYDVDTRRLTAHVMWRGLRVNSDTLRTLYAFDGCLWCLVAIKDYSLTTEQPTECEFIKIKTLTNYTNGQSY